MDHVLDSLSSYLDFYMEGFKEEWDTGKYRKYADCPYYEEVKTVIAAANCIREYLGWERTSITKELRERRNNCGGN